MKKLFSIACACVACAAFAEDIKCGNDVGMLTINSTATDVIVAVPFGELATGGNVCASNIVKTANLAKGDELYVYNNGTWTAWELTEAGTSPNTYLYWKSVGTATIDASGNISKTNTPEANTTYLVAGSAIWIKRANPSGPFYVYGSYKQELSTTVTANVYNLIANPTDAAFYLTGMSTGDMVLKVKGAASTTRYRYNATKSQWGYAGSDGTNVVVGSNLSIPAGEGVWFCPKAARTIKWRE